MLIAPWLARNFLRTPHSRGCARFPLADPGLPALRPPGASMAKEMWTEFAYNTGIFVEADQNG